MFFIAQSDYAPYFYDNGPNRDNGNMALFSLSEDTLKGKVMFYFFDQLTPVVCEMLVKLEELCYAMFLYQNSGCVVCC